MPNGITVSASVHWPYVLKPYCINSLLTKHVDFLACVVRIRQIVCRPFNMRIDLRMNLMELDNLSAQGISQACHEHEQAELCAFSALLFV
jgi:hypothetical protein